MDTPLDFAIQTAKAAGKLLSDHFVLSGTKAETKPDHSLVTQSDLAADRLITNAIREQFPNDSILSEESNTLTGDLSQPVWVIDPLDGTTNFSLGLPIWGVSIARVVDGFPNVAALYYPLLGELYWAELGKGAQMNDTPLPPKVEQHAKTSFFACCSRTFKHYQVNLRYKTRILGAATYDLCCVARGTAIMSFEVTPKIWDLAAGWLIVQEAGREIGVLEGPSPFPLQPNYDYGSQSFPTACAANQLRFSELKHALQKRKV